VRTGLTTFAAIAGFILLAPFVFGLAFWPFAGGLLGTLSALGLSALQEPAAIVLGFGTLVFCVGALANSKGTFHVSDHVIEMLPWALTVFIIMAVISLVN